MNLIIKGFIIGLGKIIPGVSGAMLAITLGIYGDIIETLSNIKTNKIEDLKFLSKIGLGIILAIVVTSKIIVKCISTYYLPTMLLFVGLIIGGMPKIIKNTEYTKKDIIISILTILIGSILSRKINLVNNYQVKTTSLDIIKLIGAGILESIASIVPGISGTALLMTIGYYNTIINTFSTLFEINKIYQNLFILIPFVTGFIVGTIAISKIINYLLKHYDKIISQVISIFMVITIFIIIKQILLTQTSLIEIIIGLILFLLGIIISIKINKE